MKKFFMFNLLVVFFCFMLFNANSYAINYNADVLESGNTGGWFASLKTFDSEWWMSSGTEISIDVWIEDVPEALLSSGFFLAYDPAVLTIMNVAVYDGDAAGTQGNPIPCCPGLPGPWDPETTAQLPVAGTPLSFYMVACANLFYAAPDASGDMINARVRVKYIGSGADTAITLTTIVNFDTVVGSSRTVYDPQIIPKTVTIRYTADSDQDCVLEDNDNCPGVANGTCGGTCVKKVNGTIVCTGGACLSNADCVPGDICELNQEDADSDGPGDVCDNCPSNSNATQQDSYPPQGNRIGDACDCEGDFDCDGDVDGTDAAQFKADYGRNQFNSRCANTARCNGDFLCDGDVDGSDAAVFKADFGRISPLNPCPCCVVMDWCSY